MKGLVSGFRVFLGSRFELSGDVPAQFCIQVIGFRGPRTTRGNPPSALNTTRSVILIVMITSFVRMIRSIPMLYLITTAVAIVRLVLV